MWALAKQGLKFIDHMVGNVDWDEMNTWCEFYAKVMGFCINEESHIEKILLNKDNKKRASYLHHTAQPLTLATFRS
ncbi:hypothetical protein N9Y26_00560 [bacterium]|nr:hypothetical protein [bacterium]